MNSKIENHSHAWRGAWNRPMLVDEDSLHPFTVARMTDHNVRGMDKGETFDDGPSQLADRAQKRERLDAWEEEGGWLRNTGGL